MSVHIRPIQTSDFEQLISLFMEFAVFEKLPDKMTNSLEQMKQEQAYFNGFVAVDKDQKILGYATYFYCYYTWVGKSLYMDDLYVSQAFRGQGIGSQLIHKVIETAKKNSCHRLRWQVSSWNEKAKLFYQKLGAEIDSVEQNCDIVIQTH